MSCKTAESTKSFVGRELQTGLQGLLKSQLISARPKAKNGHIDCSNKDRSAVGVLASWPSLELLQVLAAGTIRWCCSGFVLDRLCFLTVTFLGKLKDQQAAKDSLNRVGLFN
jgi:hypothetical protein